MATNPDNMTDEEFTAWMDSRESEIEDSEEIEVDGVDDPETEEEFEEEFEEEDGDDLEQPEEDSDDNSDDEETEDEETEDSEEEDEETDGDPEELATEQPEETKDEVKTETQPVTTPEEYKFKAGGEEFKFTKDEIMEQFPAVFAKAIDYTQKTQAIKKYRQMIDAMEQEKLTPEDMNFAIDLLKGDKDAITALIKRTGVDTLELEVESDRGYAPKNYGRSDVELDIQEITAEISRDPEYEVTHKVLTKDWDDESWEEMTKRPHLIKLLHTDVKSGTFQKINPIAKKIRMQEELKYGKSMRSDLEYYKAAVGQFTQEQQRLAMQAQQKEEVENNQRKIAEVVQKTERREATKVVAKKRKAAAPTKTSAGKRTSVNYLDEALNMSDEDYVKWMDNKL
jgi:hypothetical protein